MRRFVRSHASECSAMLLFVAVVATLNLAIGYAMGAYIGVLPRLPRRKPVEPPEPTIDLSPTVEAPEASIEKPAAPTKTAQPPKEQPASAAVAEPESEPVAVLSEPKPADAPPADVMEGLAAFQAQLAEMGEQMKASLEDDEAFGKCADQLQQANHDYLEKAHNSINDLDADPEANVECRDLIVENAKRVGEASDEIDSILADGVPGEEGRSALVEKTQELGQEVKAAETKLANLGGESTSVEPAEQVESAESASPLDRLFQTIDDAIVEADSHLIVAAVRCDPVESAPDGYDDIESRLLNVVNELANEVLESAQLAAPCEKDQLLLLLSGDSVDQAAKRIEQLRQQVEKTTVKAGDAKLQTTVTCALAEAVGEVSREELLEHLSEAIDESQRHGVNRSYHHDGHFPAPVMPEELTVASKTVEI